MLGDFISLQLDDASLELAMLVLFGAASALVMRPVAAPALMRAAAHRAPLAAAPRMLLDALDMAAAAGGMTSAMSSATSLLAFADQSGKLAGTFFMASLLPYLGFIYFLGYEKNRTPKVALFGHQFLLLFVLSTVFTGVVAGCVRRSARAATLAEAAVGALLPARAAGERSRRGTRTLLRDAAARSAAVRAAVAPCAAHELAARSAEYPGSPAGAGN